MLRYFYSLFFVFFVSVCLLNHPATANETVLIPDENLRKAVLADLTSLYANWQNISDLTGLEHATNLTELYLIPQAR